MPKLEICAVNPYIPTLGDGGLTTCTSKLSDQEAEMLFAHGVQLTLVGEN